MKWHIGCSGFHYKEWRENFYPAGLAQREWFEYYCTYFKTLELNVTFYRFPQVAFLKNWYTKSPEDFLFAVKVPRLITHYKRFSEVSAMLNDFYLSIREGLSEKLGCVLFQLPSTIPYSAATLGKITTVMSPGYCNVVEFRHPTWWAKEVYDTLARHSIGFCGASHPDLPERPVCNTDIVYYRFHGVPSSYYSEYTRYKMKKFVEAIESMNGIKTVYVYFNNTAGMGAIHNARQLQRYYCSKEIE